MGVGDAYLGLVDLLSHYSQLITILYDSSVNMLTFQINVQIQTVPCSG